MHAQSDRGAERNIFTCPQILVGKGTAMSRSLDQSALFYVLCFLVALGLLAGCATTQVIQETSTPTPEIFIPRTVVVPAGATISGHVLWGATPVAGARVELRTGAWADPAASEAIAQTIADANGAYELEAPPGGGEFGLVAVWPDGSASTAPATPVQVAAGDQRVEANVYLARELEWVEPAPGAEVGTTPTLRWNGVPGVTQYKVWVVDAGTTDLAFDVTFTGDPAGPQTVVLPPLTPGHTYTWDVQGLDADGNLVARLTGTFEVISQAALLPVAAC
jgi:hypothetical protein